MPTDPTALPATTHRLRRLAHAGALAEPRAARAVELLHATPGAAEWRAFLGRALALLGAGLLLAGVVCAVAYNWSRIGRFGKFALLEAAIVAAAVLGWRALPPTRWAARAARRVGARGAAPRGVRPGLPDGRRPVRPLPHLVRGDRAVDGGRAPLRPLAPRGGAARRRARAVLADVVAPRDTAGAVALPLLVAALHAAAIAGWEWQWRRAEPWLHRAWAPHALAAAGYLALLVAAGSAVVGEWEAGAAGAAGVAALAAAIGASFHYHRRVRPDRLMLTLGGAAGLVWLAFVAGRIVFGVLDLRVSGLFVMALVVLAELALGLRWFRGGRARPTRGRRRRRRCASRSPTCSTSCAARGWRAPRTPPPRRCARRAGRRRAPVVPARRRGDRRVGGDGAAARLPRRGRRARRRRRARGRRARGGGGRALAAPNGGGGVRAPGRGGGEPRRAGARRGRRRRAARRAAAGLVALALSAALVPLMPDRLHRFLAPLVGATGAAAAAVDLDVPAGIELVAVAVVLLAALVWRVGLRARSERADVALEPVGYGLVVALFGVLVAQASGVLGCGACWRTVARWRGRRGGSSRRR
jgi:hypothetical protein